jgi:signal transduction histidine kinase
MMASVRLRPDLASAAQARRFTELVTADLDEELRDLLALTVSEVVTNAIRHAGTVFELCLERLHGDDRRFRVEVRDYSTVAPHLVEQPTASGGFGLRIVDQASRAWGSYPLPDGKVVWFEI